MIQRLQTRHLAGLCVAASTLLISACSVSGSPAFDERFGDSARALRAQQVIDPQAAKRNESATMRADGRTVRDASDRQRESYRAPPASTVGLGTGGGSSD